MDMEFKLSDPGEGIHEAEITEILVSSGDSVKEGQPVMVVETDKASFELPSPYEGTVKEILVKAGDQVRVGDVLMIVSVDKETGQAEQAPEKPTGPEKTKPAAEAGERPEDQPRKETPGQTSRGPVPAAPATRRLARELGVEIAAVTPSGPHGRVTAEDVKAAAEGKPQEKKAGPEEKAGSYRREPAGKHVEVPPLPDFSRWGTVERKPLRSVRRTIARRMSISWSQIPHVTHQDEADITSMENFRQKYSRGIKEKGGALTLTPFILKAVVAALKEHPRFNATIDMESEEIIYKHYYHIGVAVDTDRGLLVPVLREVDCKSIADLAFELYELAERTRNGSVGREEMFGGTFTVTNVGSLGGTGFTPIINYPQSAILGVARAAWRQVIRGNPEDNRFEARLMVPLTLGFDHRIVDGADAARFMNKVIEALESPESMMINM